MKIIVKNIGVLLLLANCIHSVEAKRKTQYFSQTEFTVDFTITHTILSANFAGDSDKEILLIGERKNSQQKAAEAKDSSKIAVLYALDSSTGRYLFSSEIEIPKSALAFDLISGANKITQLLLLDSKGLSTINFKTNSIMRLEELDSIYLSPKPLFISNKELVKDLNGDELDDIIVSNFNHVTVLLQRANGEFEKMELPIRSMIDMTNLHVAYSDRTIFQLDTNFDQLPDLVVLENKQLRVYEQTADGRFTTTSNRISLPVEVSDVPWWFVRGADGESVDQSNLQHRMIEKLEDINGDGIADLMIRQTQSSGVFDRQNNYEIYFGFDQDGTLNFSPKLDTSISAEGTLAGLALVDINNDKRQEILVSSFDVGVSQIIGALLSGSIDQDVYLFSLDKDDNYGKTPLFSEEVDLNFSLSSGSAGQPVVLSADLDGDGNRDLVLSTGTKRLTIFNGEQSDRLLGSRSKRHRLKLPDDGSMVINSDLNNDKREEVIVRYGKQDDESLRNRVIILSAK